MSFTSEFKEFAMKGNVMDLALGVIIGAAFGKIVDSLVKDVIMPIAGKIFGVDFSNWFILLGNPPADFKGSVASYASYAGLSKAGVPMLAYVNFIILAFVIFLMVRQINSLKAAAPTPPPTPPAPAPEDVVLLREIRDLLNRR